MTNTPSKPGAPGRRRRGSLFFKLMAVMLGTVVLTLLLLGYFFRPYWNPDARDSTRKNLRHYAELLTHEIGTPPDFRKAERLSDKLRLGVAIRDPQGIWWFSPRVSEPIRERILARERDLPQAREHRQSRATDSVRVHLRAGRMLAIIPQSGYTFVYGTRRKQPFENTPQEWALLFTGIAGVWFLAWYFLRHQLQPVRELAKGVKAVKAGNLDERIPETGSDELADLARSFNAMTLSLGDRLRARDQLLLDVSHELRSPLTRMRVALEMAEPGSAVDSLRDEVEALGKMVSEILETERLKSEAGRIRRESVDFNELVREKIARFEGQAPGIVLKETPLPPVPVDTERVRLLLRNVLENALKYGQDAGRPVEVVTRGEGGFAIIEVRDWGAGVPEEEQRLIFEPFYRTDRSRSGAPGYGLGLPLCRRIVEAHGGTIEFRSRPGEGTVVTVRLPLA